MKNTLAKTLICIFTLVTLSFSLGVTSFAAGERVFERCAVISDSVEIRNKPSSGGAVTTVLTKDERLIRVQKNRETEGDTVWDRILLANGKTGYVNTQSIKPAKDSASIALKKYSIKAGVGERINPAAFLQEKPDEENPVRFFVSNESVLSIDQNSLVTCLKKGRAFVGFYTEKALAVLSIEITDAPARVTLNEEYVEIKKSETIDLDSACSGGYSYIRKFTSSDETVATVSSSGIVKPLKNGTVNVTVTAFNGKAAVCKIRICDNPVKIKITNANNKIQKGADNHKVTYKLTNGSSVKKVYFSVSNTSVATVNSDGYVTGLKKGKTKLTVKTDKGIKSTVTLTVVNDSMHLNKNSTQLSLDYKNVEKVKYGTSYQERNLEAFIITNKNKTSYKKTLFMDFAIHGFEDEYYRDGRALVSEAHKLINYFAKHSDELGNWRLVIVPCANPDGTVAGENNLRKGKTAFGRCTANHIDMNRDFGAFKAQETVALKNLIVSSKPDIYLNVHGWYDEAVGDKKLSELICYELGLTDTINQYGSKSGYAIGWVHDNLKIPVSLVEYPSSDEIHTKWDINMIKSIIGKY